MTVEASAAKEPGWLESALASQPLRHSASVVLATLVVGVLSIRLDPTSASTPLISASGRAYYLLALAVTIAATIAISGFNTDFRGLLEASEPGATVLVLGAATFLFVGHRSAGAIILFTALAGGTLYAAYANRSAAPGSVVHWAVRVSTVVVLALLIWAVIEFRMRTLYAGPVSALAAALAFEQLRPIEGGPDSRVAGPLVAAVVSIEIIWALGFLDVSTWLAAAIWTATFLAVVYGVTSAAKEHRP